MPRVQTHPRLRSFTSGFMENALDRSGTPVRRVTCGAVLFLAFLTGALSANAQPAAVSGRVVDAETGEGLPGANIQVVGLLRGTITNGEGYFRIDLDELPATLLFRYIGFESRRVEIGEDGPLELHIAMKPVTYELDEVFVSGEDPAANIMRKVIERKQERRDVLRSYAADAYNRYTISNDTGIVMISETLTEVFWDREQGPREVVKAQRQTSNLKLDDALPDEPYILNLYDDDVEVGGHLIMGITHPDALETYDFRLEGTRALDGQAVYDISFEPKRETSSGFVGRAAVLDSAYAMLEVELRPGKAFLFPPPIERYAIELSQKFANFGGDFWLPVNFRREARVKISWGLLLDIPEVRLEQVSRLIEYRVNVPVPDSLYDDDRFSRPDSAALAENKMQPAAAVPLTATEERAYAEIDSTMTMQRAFKPRGLMASVVQFDEDERRGGWLGANMRPLLRRNRVEDFHLGAAVGRTFGKLQLEARVAYSTGLEEWSYGGIARLRRWPIEALMLSTGYHRGIEPRGAAWLQDRGGSDIAGFVAGSDQFDYFRREHLFGAAAIDLSKVLSEVELRIRHEHHDSIPFEGETSFDADPSDRVNPAVEEGTLTSLGAQLVLGDDVLFGVSGGNRAAFSVEHSRPGLLASEFDFTFFSAAIDLRVETFLRRRFIPPTLDVHLTGGAALGDLPIQRTALVPGSSLLWGPVHFSTFGDLRTLERKAYQGDRFAALFWEHSFRSVPFELIGWRWAARKGWNVILHGAHARTWLSDRLVGEIGYEGASPDGFHHELGVSLSGIFGLFRLDAVSRLDAPGFTIGMGMGRIL